MLTAAAGMVDAVSYLRFDHTFVANMTGNVVFLGFAAAGAPSLSAAKSLVALGAFVAGAAVAGRLANAVGPQKARILAAACFTETILVAAALVLVIAAGPRSPLDTLAIALLACAMGVQTIAARRLGVTDIATTVLTSTSALLAADAALGDRSRLGIRLVTVCSMLAGAGAGAFVVLRAGVVPALVAAMVVFAAASAGAYVRARRARPRSAPTA